MKELPIHIQLNPESDKCLYEQIYEFVRNEIKSEIFRMKSFLLQISGRIFTGSRTTVDMAYGHLFQKDTWKQDRRKAISSVQLKNYMIYRPKQTMPECRNKTWTTGNLIIMIFSE